MSAAKAWFGCGVKGIRFSVDLAFDLWFHAPQMRGATIDILDGMILQIDNHLTQVKATFDMLEGQDKAIFSSHDMVAEAVLQIMRTQIVLAGQVSFLATTVQLMRDGVTLPPIPDGYSTDN